MTNKTWLYVLESEGFGRLVLEYSPIGWDEAKVSIKRSPTYYGLFREFNTALKFVKDGKDYIQQVYELKGTEWEIKIGIYEYNPVPVDKFVLFFAGIIDLSTYRIDETTIEVNVNESSFARKLMSRDSIPVNIGTLKSIEGNDITAINQVDVTLHQRELLSTAIFELNAETATVEAQRSPINTDKGFSLPMRLVSSDIGNITEPVESKIDETGSWFWAASSRPTGSLNMRLIIKGTLGVPPSDTGISRHYIAFRIYDDTSLATWSDQIIWQYTGELEPGRVVDIDSTFSIFNLTETNVIALVGTGENNIFDYWISTFTQIDVTITETINQDASIGRGYLMHEIGQKVAEVITDEKNSFRSDFYGRPDIGYTATGEGALSAYFTGKSIRGFDDSPSLTLEDFFKSENCIYNLGMGIEYNALARPYLRIEPRQHFFNGNVILTLNSVSEVTKEVAREWIYNSVKVGYEKAEYEEVNGLEEYNNKFSWTTGLRNIKNELNIVSKVRADGYGIEFARRKPKTETPTEDTKYDNEIFKVILVDSGGYKAKRNEGYDIVENIFSPATAYNLDITHGRMLRKHGAVIRAGAEKYLDQPLKFTFSEQKADMKTQRIGEASITENVDIDPNTLSAPLWIPELYKFKSILSRENLAKITLNPSGIVKFSPQSADKTQEYFYGWIIEVDGDIDGQESEWTLLRVNTQNSDVKLVDPDGSTPGTPPIVIEPTIQGGVFEGGFELIFAV